MNDINSRIFASIKQSKMVTEVYLGCIDFPWHYAKAEYSADCTEAVPLNIFENVICGLLSVNDAMSKSDIAGILGLNIVDDPTHLMFKDRGEEEILSETLITLEDYGMIKSDDDSYSRIQLTEIGREYYSRRKKFKTGLIKRFSIFYDLETKVHSEAKRIFGSVVPDEERIDATIPSDLSDEVFIKEFAHEQIPHIYDEEVGHSFTNTKGQRYFCMCANVVFGVLYNVLDKTCRLVVDPKSKIDKDYLQAAIDSNEELRQTIITQFLNSITENHGANSLQGEFEEALIALQRDIDYDLYLGNPEKAKEKVVAHNMQSPLFEEGELFTILNEEIQRKAIKEVYINMPFLSQADTEEIISLASKSDIIVYLITDRLSATTKFPDNVYVTVEKDIDELIMLANTCISPTQISFDLLGKKISTKCYERHFDDTRETVFICKRAIATKYLPVYVDSYKEFLENDWKELSKELLSSIEHSGKDILRFQDFVEGLGYREIISELDDRKEKLLFFLKDTFVKNLSADIDAFLQEPIDDINTLEGIKIKYKALKALQSRLDESNEIMSHDGMDEQNLSVLSSLQEQVSEYSELLLKHQAYLQSEVLPKIYVIDTNVFISCPTIFDYISKKDTIIVPLKVLDELDSHKTKLAGKQKKNLREAIKAINHKSKMKELEYKTGNTKILPQELQRKSGDYMILSVAYEYKQKGQNVILLTNDANFQNIAKSLGIAINSLEDIVPQEAIFKEDEEGKSHKKKSSE